MTDLTDLGIRREKIHRLIVELIFIIYWLLIFEGALRKWMFPQYHRYIFFVRDPFVLLVYFLAFTNRLLPRKTPMFTYGISLAVLYLLFALMQVIITTVGIVTLIYGWRMYFFYLPLAFIIGEHFRGKDLRRLVRQTLLIAIPIALLCYAQHKSPPSAFVNRSAGTDIVYTISGTFGGSIVRTTGTFTFFHGQQLFIGSIVAFLFTSWILPKEERPLGGKILWAATVAVIVNLVLNGTRLPYILTILISLAAAFSAFVIRRQMVSLRAMVFPVVLMIIGMMVFAWLFTTAYEATVGRHKSAEEIEGSVLMRGTRMFYYFSDFIAWAPTFGFGIGSLSSGGSALTGGSVHKGLSIEDEWTRVVAETGPIFGMIYIAFRVLLVLWLVRGAVYASRRSNNPFPLLLLGFIGIVVLVWNITGYGTEMGYAWIFTGFCIAANRLRGREHGAWGME